MQKIILFLILACVITMPVYAQHDDSCISDVNQTAPKLAEDWFTNDEWDHVLIRWTSAYLNAGAPVDAIPSYIDQIEVSTPDLIFSSTYVMDVTMETTS